MAEGGHERIERLTGAENWEIWKFTVKCLLGEKPYALEVTLGELTLPVAAGPAHGDAAIPLNAEQQAVTKNYLQGNRAAMAVLTRSIDSKVLVTVMNTTTARQMWLRLTHVYERESAVSGVALQTEFCEFTQEEGESLTDLTHRFETLLYRMTAKQILPSDSFQQARLLSSIRSDFRAFRQAWNARPANTQTMDELQSCIMNEDECQQKEAAKTQPIAVSKPADNNGNGGSAINGKNTVKPEAHITVGQRRPGQQYRPLNCPQTENGPSVRSNDPSVAIGQTRYNAPTKLTCFYCNVPGHLKRDCRKLQTDIRNGTALPNGRPTGQRTAQPTGQAHLAGTTEPDAGHRTDHAFSFICAAALAAQDNDHNDHGWYIDSGASYHMTKDLDEMIDYEPYPPGQEAQIQVGSGQFLEGLGRGNVLVKSRVNERVVEN